ncbi:trypsin-like peptidase domain-containing protein [Enterococcus faecalis]|uniref:S1 family peptidase n=1 Tax=Enterococcus faecalis TaxID=1351 RepID=UPI0013CF847F|nr:serine protease [Enterococcus faecalis]EJM6036384.1 trypsin-like peptidase domain-containing protein [Enterococcus faecalis]NFA63731.1 serine protease [Enterococcus faecalis]HAP3019610.1 trypsin-like peptidase domain-containing protein [Enterococcus faecalis]
MSVTNDIAEQLIRTTVKLTTDTGIGTGFFYKMKNTGTDFKPVIVTNRHVFENTNNVSLSMTVNKDGLDEVRMLNITNLVGNIIYHPDDSIDLAVFPCPGIFQMLINEGYKLGNLFLEENLIPNEEQLQGLSAVEEVLVIGYPNGFMDEVNNRPIVRKGITASDYKLDYNGEPIFLTDSSIYAGSSGSPVLIYNRAGFASADGAFTVSPRVLFLGINSAVLIQNLEGQIVENNIPKNSGINSRLPIGLGVTIKSNQLSAFESLLPN